MIYFFFRRRLMACTLLLLFTLSYTFSQSTSGFTKVREAGGIEEFLYTKNGLKVLLMQDHSAPVVTFQVTYRVGSANEVPGVTGATHLLEHLLFKGSPKFNKKDGTSVTMLLQNIGAQMNATTWNDRTNYYETIPSEHLELAIEIEADRMRNAYLHQADKEAEMTVVRNEFERGENSPFQLLNKEIWASAYIAHPYHHSTIGWRSDVENMPNEKLKDFYNTYYWPDNATVSVIGDFQKEATLALIDQYFGVILKAPHPFPQPTTEEPRQYGPRRVVVKKPGQMNIVNIGFKTPGVLHEDYPALSILNGILSSGKLSRLSRAIEDTGKGVNAGSNLSYFKLAGMLIVYGIPTPGKLSNEEMETLLLAELERIKNEGASEEEIKRTLKKFSVSTLLGRDGTGAIASDLNEAIAIGDWTEYVHGLERLKKISPADVQRVAQKYLVEDQSTTGYFLAQKPGGSQKPQTAGSPNRFVAEGPYYYRQPKNHRSDGHSINDTKRIQRQTINGLDLVTVKTGAKGFVKFAGDVNAGTYLSKDNPLIAELVMGMLDKGTTQHSKLEIAGQLESLGASIRFSNSNIPSKISFSGQCLVEDLDAVLSLLVEQLRYPAFNEKEFEVLKSQNKGNIQFSMDDPNTNAQIQMNQMIYPEGHPNYALSLTEALAFIDQVTLEDLKAFHQKYYGPNGIQLVIVGDVEAQSAQNKIKETLGDWKGGMKDVKIQEKSQKRENQSAILTFEQKPSATLLLAIPTGLNKTHPDYLPLSLGNFALGGGFSGRLMQTVRDEEGLTYQIGSTHSGDILTGGHWMLSASFNPTLLEKGYHSTMKQIKNWVEEGITQEELASKKSNLVGSFEVNLSSAAGMAGTILYLLNTNRSPEYIYEYSEKLNAVTLDQVNAVIKKYIDPEKMVVIRAGSIDAEGKPLK